MLDNTTKEQIREQLNNFCSITGSNNLAFKKVALNGAYGSNILNRKWESISDGAWRKLAASLNMKLDEQWQHADTMPYQTLSGIFGDAQRFANVFGVICIPGSGKTYTMNEYKKAHKDVIIIKCQRHTTERDFLKQALTGLGFTHNIFTITGLLNEVFTRTAKMTAPLFIVDEIEKVKNDVLFMFIDFYNELHNKAGIVLLGTPNLATRIYRGVEKGKICYNEILSRLGGKLLSIPAPTQKDGAAVVRANGIAEQLAINTIVNDSLEGQNQVDLRRVERLVHKTKITQND
ncbi:ATP-binding protein [Mucilaginibacter sp. L3T2-6]|uniref:ATP-binding protein n=1 Tax=Mucilaginibacter sp. L3T2-6 TaxID=3062491 RepID=UPI002675BC18|nr:ATP-binding protein [Mucilaginibacter sp. L3T2-6]MDO3641945.1 ATP-binding protein [Mucilaginibacter sp. L3T2-6]MDV6214377.1 ATP-binding protein [Mucilaginibacter sp. L3T2-6]